MSRWRPRLDAVPVRPVSSQDLLHADAGPERSTSRPSRDESIPPASTAAGSERMSGRSGMRRSIPPTLIPTSPSRPTPSLNGLLTSPRFSLTARSCRARTPPGPRGRRCFNRLADLRDDPFRALLDAWDIDLRYTDTRGRGSCSHGDAHGDRRAARDPPPRVPESVVHRAPADRAGGGESRAALRDAVSTGRESHRMLRAEFRPAHYGAEAPLRDPVRAHQARDDGADSVEKAQFEVRAHKWIATRDDGGGSLSSTT